MDRTSGVNRLLGSSIPGNGIISLMGYRRGEEGKGMFPTRIRGGESRERAPQARGCSPFVLGEGRGGAEGARFPMRIICTWSGSVVSLYKPPHPLRNLNL